jgi:hypothetical protein
MTTNIELAYNRAADALAITLEYPKLITDALKRRDAAKKLAELTPRDAAHEIAAANNPRAWDSILDAVATHNARCAEAKNAIRGGVLTHSNRQLDQALAAWVPEYADATHDVIAGILATLTDAARAVDKLDAQHAVTRGYGDALTALFTAVTALTAHTLVGQETTGTDATTRASHMLAMVTAPPNIDPIRRTDATRHNMGGEVVSSPEDQSRRQTARDLMGDFLKDTTGTFHRLARNEYPGHQLSAATADDYRQRVEQYLNADRITRVAAA